jgi:hypothetical protein
MAINQFSDVSVDTSEVDRLTAARLPKDNGSIAATFSIGS